jgi:hypothetical protein
MSTTQEFGVQIRGAFAGVVEIIPRRAQLALQVGAVAIAVVALAAQRIVAIWWPEYRPQVDATVAEILPWAMFVAGVIGAAYSPKRGELLEPIPHVPSHVELAQAQDLQAKTMATLMANGWTKSEATEVVTQNSLLPAGDSPGYLGAPRA